MVVWYWQKDLRKNGKKEEAWEAYSAAESAKLEKAFQKKQKTMTLSEKYKIDFNEMIQHRVEDRNRQRAIKREDEDEEEEEEEEEKPAKKKAKVEKKEKKTTKKAAPAKKKEVSPKKALAVKKKKMTKKEIKAMITGTKRDSDDFYITSGFAVCGTEHDIFNAAPDAEGGPALSGTVFIQATQNTPGYAVKKGKWTFFQSNYVQACYHESVNVGLINEAYLGELSQAVFDNFPNFWKGTPQDCKDFRLCCKIGRYDWGMDGDPDKDCLFFHFVDKEKAKDLVKGHRVLGQDFWDEAYDLDLTPMTQIWDDKQGGGACWKPQQEYRYGYLCTNKDASGGNEATLFVVYGYEALPE